LVNRFANFFQKTLPATADLGTIASAVLETVGLKGIAPTNDFNEVTFLFLKQFRAVAGHPSGDFQKIAAVPGAVVSIPSAVQVEVWPLFWPARVTITEFARSVNIASKLGLQTSMDVYTSFRVTVDLEIRDGTLIP
jgi:hypothetical protein